MGSWGKAAEAEVQNSMYVRSTVSTYGKAARGRGNPRDAKKGAAASVSSPVIGVTGPSSLRITGVFLVNLSLISTSPAAGNAAAANAAAVARLSQQSNEVRTSTKQTFRVGLVLSGRRAH